jgi:addiction module HigA family antidote
MTDERIAPVHPGIYLNELMEELSLSQERLARDLGVAETDISGILDGSQPITAELSLRLGRVFEQSPRYWLNLQSRYEMDMAEDTIGSRVIHEVHTYKAVA